MLKPFKQFFVVFLCLIIVNFVYKYSIQYHGKEVIQKNYKLGTGDIKLVFYPTGGAISQLADRDAEQTGVNLSVVSTAGSVFNVEAIRDGKLDMGLSQSSSFQRIFTGSGKWSNASAEQKAEAKQLRALCTLYVGTLVLVVRDKSDIHSVKDLKGKRVGVGAPDAGLHGNVEDVLRVVGLAGQDDLTRVPVSGGAAQNLFAAGKLDAFFVTVGHPNRLLQQAVLGKEKVRFVPMDDVDKLLSLYHYYVRSFIPVEHYPQVANKEDVQTIGVPTVLVGSTRLSDHAVKSLLGTIYDNMNEFKTMHPTLSLMNQESLVYGFNPDGKNYLHPGAKAFFEEKKILLQVSDTKEADKKRTRFKIGGSNILGDSFPVAGAMAKIFNTYNPTDIVPAKNASATPGVLGPDNEERYSVISFENSIEVMEALLEGEIQFALVGANLQYEVATGQGDWERNPNSAKLRSIGSLYETSLVVAVDPEVATSFEGLEKKRVSASQRRGQKRSNRIDVFNYNKFFDSQKLMRVCTDESTMSKAISLYENKDIDGILFFAAHPTRFVSELFACKRQKIMLPVVRTSGLVSRNPYFSKTTIQKRWYGTTIPNNIPSISIPVTLVTTTDVSNADVERFTSEIFKYMEQLSKSHPVLQELRSEVIYKGQSALVHEGAINCFKQVNPEYFKILGDKKVEDGK